MSCKTIVISKRKVCVGDMREKITISTRSLTAPVANSVDFGETLSASKTVWAAIQTHSGKEIFDGTSLIGVATHFFYIRALSGQTFEDWVEYADEYYRILSVENYDEDNRFMVLRCSIRGDVNQPVNLA